MLYEPFRNAVHFHGVQIVGAYVQGDMKLSDGVIERFLGLHGSFLDGSVAMSRLSTPTTLSFGNTRVTGTLHMDSSAIGESLLLQNAKLADVVLRGAEIGDQLSMAGATVTGKLDMDSSAIGRNLFLRDAKLADVILRGADIGGQLDLERAMVTGTLDMASVATGGSLHLGDAKLADVILRGAEIGDQLNLERAMVTGTLDMDSSLIGGELFLRDAKLADVILRGAEIGSQLSMTGATVTGKLNMDSSAIGESLYLGGAKLADVDLPGAVIGNQLSMTGATVTGKLNMDSSAIGRNLFLRDAKLVDVVLLGADIGGQLDLERATVTGTLNMDSVAIGESLLLRNAQFVDVRLLYASIGSNLDARGTLLSRLNLTGTQIEGELRLGTSTRAIAWKGCDDAPNNSPVPRLTLQNVTVDALQDTVTAWPDCLDRELEGFAYTRLGGLEEQEGQEGDRPYTRGPDWFIGWLEADRSFSPQPYWQLARVLEAAGHENMAGDVRYAGRERERSELGPTEARWWGLSALYVTIGYGYGWRFFSRALAWIVFFTALGAVIVRMRGERAADGRRLGVWYSLDMLLPIIRLRERHYEVDISPNTCVAYYFYFHKVVGYVLVSFVLAGLTGLAE